MSAILQGSLAHFHIDEVLTLLSSNKHTGALEASSSKQKARIFFKEGAVVHAEATKANTPKEAILAPFTWAGGSFSFSQDGTLPEGASAAALDLTSVIGEGRQRASEWQQFAKAYPDENITLKVVDSPAIQGSITLSPDEFRLLVRVGAGRNLAQLSDDLQMPAIEIFRTVHRLETAGLLKRTDGAPTEIASTAVIDRSMIRAASAQEAPTQPGAKAAPRLVGTLTAPTGSMFPLSEAEMIIGRDPSCAIALNDNSISPTHAKITRGDQGFTLEDLGSKNGTFLNDHRVTQKRSLSNQDVVRVGKVVLTFNLSNPAAATKPHKSTR